MRRTAKSSNAAEGSRSSVKRVRRTLVFISSAEISDCLIHAIERQFAWIRVVQVDGLAAACIPLQDPAALFLVDNALLGDLPDILAVLQKFHPAATLAILQGETSQAIPVADILALPKIRGVLPMELKLDLWLSVLQLLLQGGAYIPPPMFAASARNDIRAPLFDRRGSDLGTHARKSIGALTEREFQILELVSHGLQNKLIAGRLGLSENTIKIHLHNIITKLGVHNRTEAAGLFRDRSTSGRQRAGDGYASQQQS